jgi:hypothetical protein
MARLNQILVLSALSLLTLAGCDSAQEASTPQNSPSAVPATVKTDKATPVLNYPELSGLVFYTKNAVQAGNFAKAKTEFGKFENAWKKFEDGIKAKAPKSYNEVEDTSEKVTTEFKKSQPSKDKLIVELDSLDKTIKTFPKS